MNSIVRSNVKHFFENFLRYARFLKSNKSPKILFKALLDTKLQYAGIGREILLSKQRKLDSMNSQETLKLHEYLRDIFMEKYMVQAIQKTYSRENKKQGLTRKKQYASVVKIET